MLQLIKNTIYEVKCFFKPHNIIKMSHLDKGWHDRDSLMFHACFQLLVDFVELEQPFNRKGFNSKRHTNIAEMWDFVNSAVTKEGLEEYYGDWYDDDMKKFSDEAVIRKYKENSEILRLYEWYINKQYDFDYMQNMKLTGYKYEFENNKIQLKETGNKKHITINESIEIREEHEASVRANLQRLIDIRECLLT